MWNEHSQLLLRHLVNGRWDSVDDQRREFEKRRVVVLRVGSLLSQRDFQVLHDHATNVLQHVLQRLSAKDPTREK